MLPGPDTLPAGALESAVLSSLPGKQPLIKRTYRPPNYETPPAALNDPFTPNSRFFVRYHLSSIPAVDAAAWKLRIGGDAVGTPLEYTLAELQRRFEVVDLAAVCQCAGNRRGLFQPHVPGIQWGHGAMGNALWKGIRLRDVLSRAHLKKEALEVTFDGADTGVLAKTPDFVKSLPLAKALDDHTLIAFAMNGEALPHWNGFPARLVVPGWTATYWVKHLNAIDVVSKAFDGFWMKTAYRIPTGLFAEGGRFLSQQTETSTPVTELLVNSLITHPADGQRFGHGDAIDINGVAWDGGQGISRVEISTDGGRSWDLCALGKDYGPYAWRPWVYRFAPSHSGTFAVKVRATNRSGSTQGTTAIENPAGYHHNAIQTITIHRV
ncbi:MAG: molybdopterin-dependent oxidoreductase [Methylotetracoccus sp.]|nr:molybdopterin-dependent oxidoreductase [Methylotetracoccus sp.]